MINLKTLNESNRTLITLTENRDSYKKFIITSLKLRETETIYVLPDVSETNVINYIDANCFKKEDLLF